jgi:hypothetical protein
MIRRSDDADSIIELLCRPFVLLLWERVSILEAADSDLRYLLLELNKSCKCRMIIALGPVRQWSPLRWCCPSGRRNSNHGLKLAANLLMAANEARPSIPAETSCRPDQYQRDDAPLRQRFIRSCSSFGKIFSINHPAQAWPQNQHHYQ